jgi:AcrR family transcriptional regulator
MATSADQSGDLELIEGTPCERRLRIIAAASELLEEAGLDGLTIRAVLKRSGLARRAFYERFVGKDDLVLAVFEANMADAGTIFKREAQAFDSPLEKLRHIIYGLVIGALGNESGIGARHASAIVREHMRLAESRPAELERALRPLLQTIADPIREGIEAGQFRQCDPDLHARLIYNLLATTLHTALLQEKDERRVGRNHGDWLADQIWEFCRRAVVA